MSDESLKPLPFNACDYRCERCLETERCAVFQKLRERSTLHRVHGKDEDAIETILEDVEDMFREAEEMIREQAGELGIDLDVVAADTALEDAGDDPRDDPLYNHAHDFTMQTHQFLQKAEQLVRDDARGYFDDIVWHHTVVTAKIFHALGSDGGDEVFREDSRNSGAVALKSLTICGMAFDYLASCYPDIADECRRLEGMARIIKEEVRMRFLTGQTNGSGPDQ